MKPVLFGAIATLLFAGIAPAGDGPIVISRGGTYSGNWESADPAVPAVRIDTREPVVIENSRLRGTGALIVADAGEANVVVRDTIGVGMNPNVDGRAVGRFFQGDSVAQLTIEHCELNGTAGIYVHRIAAATRDAAPAIRIVNNLAQNIDGRRSDGQGGYRDFNVRTRVDDGRTEEGFDVVQFVQFDGVVGLAQGEIAWNHVVNEPGRSRVEDNISLYESSGVPDHPIRVHDNCVVGAYAVDPTRTDDRRAGWQHDWSYSGGGIMLGDGPAKTPDTASSFLHAYANVVIATTNYGIAASSGHDIDITGNLVMACGILADGRRVAAQNVGIYVWDAGHGKKRSPATFFAVTGSGNSVAWTDGTGRSRNDWWVPDAAEWTSNTHLRTALTPADEAREIDAWHARAAKAGQIVGVRPATRPAAD